MPKNKVTLTKNIHGRLVEVDVGLKLDGDWVTLNQQDAKKLLNCIHWSQRPPVSGRISLIVEAETIQSSVVWTAGYSKQGTTVPTRT